MDATKLGERLLELGKHNIILLHSNVAYDAWELYYSTKPDTQVGILAVGTIEHVLTKGLEVIEQVLKNEGKK
jgi:hypothetical protein